MKTLAKIAISLLLPISFATSAFAQEDAMDGAAQAPMHEEGHKHAKKEHKERKEHRAERAEKRKERRHKHHKNAEVNQ